MPATDTNDRFKAPLFPPKKATARASVSLPKYVSEKLAGRGRTTVVGTINGHDFLQILEPDGPFSRGCR